MNRGWKRRCSRAAGSASPCAGGSTPCGDKPARVLSCYSSCKSTEVGPALASWASALWEILLHLTGGSGGGWLRVFPKWSSRLDFCQSMSGWFQLLMAPGDLPSWRICSIILPGSEVTLAGLFLGLPLLWKGLWFCFCSQWEFHQAATTPQI